MKSPQECKNIDEVRSEIDSIDSEIVGLISKRHDFIKVIVKYKSNVDDVYAKERYNAVLDERRKIAAKHKLNPEVIEKIFRLMMDYFIEEQIDLLHKNK